MLLLLVAATISLSVLTTNISVNFAMARGAHGGVGPVFQEPVNSGNSDQDKQINKFYHCMSKAHEDPPTVEKVDNCYHQALGHSTGR